VRTDETFTAARVSSESSGGRLAELYERHSQAGMRLAYFLAGDRPRAEDLLQEAFVRAAGRLGAVRDEQAFGPYLRRTIVNLHASQMRRRRLERDYLKRESGTDPAPPSEPDVALQEDLWQMLLGLPTRQRAALFLRFYEDRSEADTADVLGCSKRAVRSLVQRAVTQLRIDYGGDEE
jgi:RNA polymerase sigma-70 factor (sigma-E family)